MLFSIWGEGVLWMNPPFNVFDQVLDKILKDEAHTRWLKSKFYHQAHGSALDCVNFPVGTKLFERRGQPVGGITWPVSVFLVCGHSPRCEKCEFHNGRGEPESEITSDLEWGEEEPPVLDEPKGFFDPFLETPESAALFEAYKWGLRLPPGEGGGRAIFAPFRHTKNFHSVFGEGYRKKGRKRGAADFCHTR